MTLETRINEKGALEIPQGFREQLHLEPGATVRVSVEGQTLLVRQVRGPRTPREIEQAKQVLTHWSGALQGIMEADGFASVDEYMRTMRSRDDGD